MPAAKPRKRRAYVLNEAEDRILHTVHRYHLISPLQVTKLLYQRSSLHWAQTKLRTLFTEGYLDRDRVPFRRTTGTPPFYYVLSRDGMQHLAAGGVEIPARARPYRIGELDYYHVAHHLAVNEVLLSSELLCRQYPDIKLARLLHQEDLVHRPVYITDLDGKQHAVRIDGFLDFELHHVRARLPLVLELDRGTENQGVIRTKVRRLLRFAAGPYQEAFGRQALLIAFLTTKDGHLPRLLTWIGAELDQLNATPQQRELVRAAYFPIDWNVPEEEQPSPAELFFAPRWHRLTAPEPVPLLPAPP
jgi:hypothetical protein